MVGSEVDVGVDGGEKQGGMKDCFEVVSKDKNLIANAQDTSVFICAKKAVSTRVQMRRD